MIEVDGLTVTYGDVVAVADVSFSAPAGRVTAVVGPNGAGKTSTIEALEGFRKPAAGRMSVLSLDPRRDRRVLAGRMGVMLQETGIHPAVRVGEVVAHGAALYGRAWVPAELIERVGLSGRERRTFRQLSGGEQKRLALALAVVGRPEVLFLDEPTAGVDPAGRVVIRDLVAELRNDGVTVVLAGHELGEIEKVADRVVVFDRGRRLAEGTLAELTASPSGEGEIGFRVSPEVDPEALGRHLGATVVAAGAGVGTYRVRPAPGVGSAEVVARLTAWLVEQGCELHDLRTERRSLEDVFFDLTGEGSSS